MLNPPDIKESDQCRATFEPSARRRGNFRGADALHLSKRFKSLSKRAILVSLAPGTGKTTLTVLLNEALARRVDPMEFVQLHLGRLPKSMCYHAGKLREVLGFAPPQVQHFADADAVIESSDPYWQDRATK
ncbi:unnamed protein product [Symbiodinium natans]|uniref:Uncharacterized protein n=1 Tax=Symbiodinium natans TaxID=878477 RepID=A0A812KZD7_9DINO|nr:unnamed protein product [Symbiodinium natans]